MNKVYIGDIPDIYRLEYEKLKTAPLEEQRFKYFGHDIGVFSDTTRWETDTCVYWAITNHTPKWNNKTGIYLKNKSSAGCTYDKTTKKFKWWFGKQVMSVNVDMHADMCKYFNAGWFMNEPIGIRISTTNSVFVKVLQGKITNINELLKNIIKVNPTLRAYDLDLDKVYAFGTAAAFNRIQSIADYIDVAKDVNVLLDFLCDQNTETWMLDELVRLAKMLGRKVDFSWTPDVIKLKKVDWQQDVDSLRGEWLTLLSF